MKDCQHYNSQDTITILQGDHASRWEDCPILRNKGQ